MSKQAEHSLQIEKLLKQDHFIWALDKTKLLHQLVYFLKKKPRLLISAGLKASNIRSMTQSQIFSEVVFNPSAAKIIEDFLRGETANDIDKYLAEQKHTTAELFELMLLARTESLKLLTNLEEQGEQGARLYVACCFSKSSKMLQFARKLEGTLKSAQKKKSVPSLLMHNIVQDPNYLTVDKENNDDNFLMLFACMVAARFREFDVAEQLKEKILDSQHVDEEALEKIQASLEHYLDESKPQGAIPAEKLQLAQPGEFDNVNVEELEVLAVCQRYISKEHSQIDRESSFSEVLAVKRPQSSTWKEMSKETAAKLFPTLGSIAHFSGRLKPAPPRHRQFGVWKVRATSKPQDSVHEGDHEKIAAIAKIMPVFQIRSFDMCSTDTDALVNEITNICLYRQDEDDHDIIRLADSLYIKPQAGMRRLVESEFMDTLQAWRQMSAIQLGNGLNLHIGDLPDTSLVLDLSRSKKIIEKSLKHLLRLNTQEREQFAKAISTLTSDPKLFELIEEMQIENLMWQHEEFAKLANRMRSMPEFASALVPISGSERKDIAKAKSQINNEKDEYKRKISELKSKLHSNCEKLVRKANEVEKLVTEKGFENLERRMTYLMAKDPDNLVKNWKLGETYSENQKQGQEIKMLAMKIGELQD